MNDKVDAVSTPDRIEAREKLLAALSGGPDLPPRDVDEDIRKLVRFIAREHKLLPVFGFIENCRATPDSTRQQFERHRESVQRDWFPLLYGIDLVREQVRDARRRLNGGVYVTEDFRILFVDRHGPNALFELSACETVAAFVLRWSAELPRLNASDAELHAYLNWLSGIDFPSLERCLVAAEREFEAAFAGPALAKKLGVALNSVQLGIETTGRTRIVDSGETKPTMPVRFHDAETPPPKKFQDDNGHPFGPVRGLKHALGFAIHPKSEIPKTTPESIEDPQLLKEQSLTKNLRAGIEKGTYWAREIAGSLEVELFFQSHLTKNRAIRRLDEFNEWKKTKLTETLDETG